MHITRRSTALVLLCLSAALGLGAAAMAPEDDVLALLDKKQPYTLVPASVFDGLGWDLPDGGAAVKKLAESAPGSAFDPRALEPLPAAALGYRPKSVVVRYPFYGLDWDITGLYLEPLHRVAGLPTMVYINGGSANVYEFFVDPHNNAGIGQYLAQRIPVLIVTIPGNYKPGGWTEPPDQRAPAYLLDRASSGAELKVRNAVFTNVLIAEGVKRIIQQATVGPVLISGHSTSGELQFLLRDALADRLRGRSIGWGTGGPAWLRGTWETDAAAERNRSARKYPPVTDVRGRDAASYAGGYLGPLNPITGPSRLDIARTWLELESRRRPWFKQSIQDIEHTASVDQRDEVERTIRAAAAASGLPVNAEAAIKDLFATMRTPIDRYQRMIWTTAMSDDGHWDPDATKARELFVANQFRAKNPGAEIRVLVYDVPMTHYGHIERPRQLAGGTLAAIKWVSK
jgi:hypothetical protein